MAGPVAQGRACRQGATVAVGALPAYARAVRSAILALLAALLAPVAASAQDEESYSEPAALARLHLTAWGGTLIDLGGQASAAGLLGGEVSWSFDTLDVGVLGQGYHLGERARTPWTPVILARFEQHFETRRGLDATLALGLGAGRTDTWIGWYQFALGLRLNEGPIFIVGEVGFEQLSLFRLAAGVGFRL